MNLQTEGIWCHPLLPPLLKDSHCNNQLELFLEQAELHHVLFTRKMSHSVTPHPVILDQRAGDGSWRDTSSQTTHKFPVI